MSAVLSLVALLAVSTPTPPRELHDYLSRKDASYAVKVVSSTTSESTLEMTSQTWQGIPWKHQILIRRPAEVVANDTAILFITGDGPRAGDYRDLAMAATLAKLPVAMLFDIPNQPLWDHREDDLIAHTFEKYLETGDASWPLLFPMAKSAIRAMDAVQGQMPGIKKFIVTGASKRGWTTWMTGASRDKRIIGIAPMVIDNLNLNAQMKHQMALWHEFSPQIQDYTRRGLQQQLASPRGMRLAQIVDPYSYRRDIKMPTLIVNGGNDPYWTVDALSQYWGDLRQPKWATIVPNAGHNLGDGIQAISAIGAFSRAVSTGKRLPNYSADWKGTGKAITLTVRSTGAPLESVSVWAATDEHRHYVDAKWKEVVRVPFADATEVKKAFSVPVPEGPNVVLFTQFRYVDGAMKYTLSTPAHWAVPLG